MQLVAKDILTLPGAIDDSPLTCEKARVSLAVASLRISGRLYLQVHGESMLPTLWPGDKVEVAACTLEDACPGEIVLAVKEGRFFLHRFLGRVGQDSFRLRGDSMPAPDPEFPNEALLGRVVNREGDWCAERGRDRVKGKHEDVRPAPPVLPLRPWSWAAGRILCHFSLARRLALKLHLRKRLAQARRTDGGTNLQRQAIAERDCA